MNEVIHSVGMSANTTGGQISTERLSQFIERIEVIEEQRTALGADVRDIYAQAKGEHFDVKTLRQIVRLRKLDAEQRREHDALLDLYRAALGV